MTVELEFPRFDGQLRAEGFQPSEGSPFVVDRGEIAEGRVSAPGIVPAFDEFEDGHTRLGLGLELPAVEEFAFEVCEEALAHRVVVRVADCDRTRRPWPCGLGCERRRR